MKIKTISRDAQHHTRECVSTKTKVFRNADPKLHPMEKAREVSRAVTTALAPRPLASVVCGSTRDFMGVAAALAVARVGWALRRVWVPACAHGIDNVRGRVRDRTCVLCSTNGRW